MDEIDQQTALLQFIDLSDIEEPERNSILASLQRNNPSVRGPWKIIKPVPKIVQVQQQQQQTPPRQPSTITQVNGNNALPAVVTVTTKEEPAPVKPSTPGKSWASILKQPNQAESNGTVNEAAAAIAEPRTNGIAPVAVQNGAGIPRPPNPEFDDPNYYRIAEYLATHKIQHTVVNVQPRGLVNRSNYCYINSILQALLACPPFYNLMAGLAKCASSKEKRKHTNIIDNMAKFITEFKHLPPNATLNRAQKQLLHQQGQQFTSPSNSSSSSSSNSSSSTGDRTQQPQPSLTCAPLQCDVAFEPLFMYRTLNGVRNDTFQVEGRQEDAEEFLGCLLNGLNDEMLELIKLVKTQTDTVVINTDAESESWQTVVDSKNKGTITRRTEVSQTPISHIFGGQLRSRVHRSGDPTTDNIQPFFTLQLHIEKVSSVREALEQLVVRNPLEGVISSRTNKEVEAWQQVTIEELPIVLILHLKYFDYRLDGCTKIIKQIEFPIDLKIESKLLSSKTTHPPAAERQYQLFAVVYHDGRESTKGHYVTDTYHPGYGSWLRCDDATVRPIHAQSVLRPHGARVPYLLFYRRADSVNGK